MIRQELRRFWHVSCRALGAGLACIMLFAASAHGEIRHGLAASASSVRVLNVAADGTRTNGKILGIDPASGTFSCSGTALNTPSRSIVLTAGHCVIERGKVTRKLTFVPAYDHGSRPFGTFAVESVHVMPNSSVASPATATRVAGPSSSRPTSVPR